MKIRQAKIILSALLFALPATAFENRMYYRLAAEHAPMIFQETGHNPKADALTRFDFDGDHKGNNNWQNLSSFPTPAFVYYDVRESKSHYFIMYSFFHPRDYSYFCIPWVCHENDLEGAMLTIEKTEMPMGKLVAIQTLAHDRIYTHDGIGGIRPTEGERTLAADDSISKKTALFIEWGGHGVYAWDPGLEAKLKENAHTYLYSHEQLQRIALEKYTKDWLVYDYGAQADDPKGAAEGNYKYELLPLYDELWDRRGEIGQEHVFAKVYDFKGTRFELKEVPAAFSGTRYGSGRARPPWAWADMFAQGENRGEWFLDPAVYVSKAVRKYQKQISLDYVFNPYVQ
ncbi:MAG: hypothetical protein ABL958_03475 [Bdellovibrionia bacterium]